MKDSSRAYSHILLRQERWAMNQGIALIGSQGTRGRRLYTPTLGENLFQPLRLQTRTDIMAGDGGELVGTGNRPAKMQALHSSSALGVNIFDYWNEPSKVPDIAAACGFCRQPVRPVGTSASSPGSPQIRFEQKFDFGEGFTRESNMDVLITGASAHFKAFAVECKFTEAYSSRRHPGLKPKYLAADRLWTNLLNLRKLAISISPDDNDFHHLHPAQLVKHVLGLTHRYGKTGFRLLYLWYDGLGAAGARHRDETTQFGEVARSDGVKFHSLTYQELFATLVQYGTDSDNEYLKYLTSRYL